MIVDWNDNSRQILNTYMLKADDPSDSKCKYKQELILIKYMISVLGYNKESCYNQWKAIENGTAASFSMYDELDMTSMFNKMYDQARRVKYARLKYTQPLEPVVMYQSEVDYLNSLNAPLWVRQYWGALWYYYKFDSQNSTIVEKSTTLSSWCIRHTDIKTKRYGSVCQDAIAKYKRNLNKPVIQDFVRVKGDKYSTYKPGYIATSGVEAFKSSSIDDVDKFLSLLTPTLHTCSECGKSYEASTKCKRTMCEECYKEYRRKVKAEYMRSVREK